MNHERFSAKKVLASCALILLQLTLRISPASAQAPNKKPDARSGSQAGVQQELVRIETGFFEAWKTKDLAYLREHMVENSLFWGEVRHVLPRPATGGAAGLPRKFAPSWTVYGLSDFGALPLASGALSAHLQSRPVRDLAMGKRFQFRT